MVNVLFVFFLFFVICGNLLGQCPIITLNGSIGNSCGTTPFTLTGNTFGGSASRITITENGGGSVSPSSTTSSIFSFTYTPNTSDIGKKISITFVTNNPPGSCQSDRVTFTLNIFAVPSAPLVGTITKPTCSESSGSVFLNNLPPSGTWTLIRSPGEINTSGSGTSTIITDLPAGLYTYRVASPAMCLSSPSSNIDIPEATGVPELIVGEITQPTCYVSTGSVVLSGLPGAGIWTLTRYPEEITTSGTGRSFIATGLSAGTYRFRITNSSGCSSLLTENIVINLQAVTPAVPVISGITSPTCLMPKGSVRISGLPAGKWTLTRYPGTLINSGSGQSATITDIEPGLYNYTVTNENGCVSGLSSNVLIPSIPVPDAPDIGAITQPSPGLLTGSVVLNNLPGNGTWSIHQMPDNIAIIGSGTTYTISGLQPGIYNFSITNPENCTSGLSEQVKIGTITDKSVIIPGLITPNMDGSNDYLVIKGISSSDRIELMIFDRRGVQVFQSDNYDHRWNGIDMSGKPLVDDTYFYVINTSKNVSVKGFFVIKR